MKKTLTVNLGGSVYHIDEDAYSLLEKYLSNLQNNFKKDEEGSEIISDIETRIAELFTERIRLGHEVITIVETEQVIKRMGTVEDILGDETEETKKEETNNFSKKTLHRKLFRNPQNNLLGGVAGGVAAYQGWDVTIVRLVLIILLFLFPFTIPAYIILWIFIPKASTATEILQMKGEDVTVESIGKTLTNDTNESTDQNKKSNYTKKAADKTVNAIGIFARALLIILSIVLLPPLLLILFVLSIVLIAMISGGWEILTSAIDPRYLILSPGVPDAMLFIAGLCTFLTFAIPISGAAMLIASYIFKLKPISSAYRKAAIIVFFAAILINFAILMFYGFPFPLIEFNHHMINPVYFGI